MIWFKRLAPFVFIAIAVVAYWRYSDYRAAQEARLEHDLALAAAHVWVASAKYRDDSERFLQYRDSVLKACSLSVEEVRLFMDENKMRPEKFYPQSKLIKEFVDSLLEIEDSLRHAEAATQ